MNNSTLNLLLRDYEQKKYKADLTFEKERNAFYNSHPELAEIKIKLGRLALDISKAVLNGNTELEKELKNKFNKLTNEKNKLLSNLDIPKRSLCSYIWMYDL